MLNLTIRQFRTLVAIAKHGKISHAANALGLTSPAVTLQLQQIEAELNVQLFIREKKGVITTEAGHIALDHARTILSSLDALEENIASLHNTSAGTIRLGVVSTGKYFAPRIIAAFTEIYPDIEIRLITGNRTETVKRLKDHDVDVALMGRPPRDVDVKATIIGDHPHIFVASPEHPLAGRLDIVSKDLAEYRTIIREPTSGTRMLYELFMAEAITEMKYAPTEMDSNETIKQAVAAGLGIAILSGHTLEQELESGKIVILDVVDTPIKRHWFLVRRSSRESTPAIEAFEKFLFENGMRMLPIIGKTYQLPSSSAREITEDL